jgi:hypothetical protein
MFFPGSRYEKTGTYTVQKDDGSTVVVTRIPGPRRPALRGFHRRLDGQRLDLIAHRHLKDASGFWRLCDASGVMAPDALAGRELVGIPAKEG